MAEGVKLNTGSLDILLQQLDILLQHIIICTLSLDAELIVSDASQYNKVSKTTGTNPEDSWKEYKTRTYGDLTDMSRYVDVNAEVKLDKYGGIIDPMMRQKATGFFYSKKLGDRWWIIDPLGYPCHIRALSGVVYSYQGFPKQSGKQIFICLRMVLVCADDGQGIAYK